MIYFARKAEDGPIKIGFTSGAADARLSELQTGNPSQLHVLATATGDKQVEKALHSRFSHLRIRGEWFRGEPELLGFIDGLAWASSSALPSAAAESQCETLEKQILPGKARKRPVLVNISS